MYRVAARTLREAGRAAAAEDVVMAAMESLMRKPPNGVKNWEALMVHTTKMRALDLLKSAAVQHSAAIEITDSDGPVTAGFEDDVIEAVDLSRAAMAAYDKLAILDVRHRQVAWEYVAKGRLRGDVAAELGVSPGRVSQMATAALEQLKKALEMEGVEP
jgi:RNA polymerase sigma-70 factor (ECF subfamily)